jgi:hypothetical protein
MAIRAGVFGWGVVAPKSPDISAFARNLASSDSWLSPFDGFGPANFLAGTPEFRFDDYRAWIDRRFAPRHFQTLKEKMDLPKQYALGAFIQALEQNPGIEEELRSLGSQAHVYVGTGLGSPDTIYRASIALYEAQKRWNRFWAQPEHNSARRCRSETCATDDAYWMERSPELREYLAELASIEGLKIEGEVEAGKLGVRCRVWLSARPRREALDGHWRHQCLCDFQAME